MDWVKVVLRSKRAQAAITAVVVTLASKYVPSLGIDEATATKIVAVICAWILGETYRPAIGASNAKA